MDYGHLFTYALLSAFVVNLGEHILKSNHLPQTTNNENETISLYVTLVLQIGATGFIRENIAEIKDRISLLEYIVPVLQLLYQLQMIRAIICNLVKCIIIELKGILLIIKARCFIHLSTSPFE